MERTFANFRKLVTQRTGIVLPPEKDNLIRQRLARRIAEVGARDTSEYLDVILTDEALVDELDEAVEAMTTNTTYFFREPQHFAYLEQHILPELEKAPRHRVAFNVKVWSAAASEGAEAYSIGMLLEDVRQTRFARMKWGIIGTDISRRMLQRARTAIYMDEQLQAVPDKLSARFITRGRGEDFQGLGRISPDIRGKIKFGEMNLMDKNYPMPIDVDVVFLRNVLIYFDSKDQNAIVERIIRHIAPGGYLIVGHSESMVVKSARMTQVKPTIFRKGMSNE